ncbi:MULTISPECIES: thiamine diphosphokinase [Lysinibacillus]|jgi:thiamine pyrophosphokinase|uniref:thiamine diphosphokinase n=1 Tax=Lysinibacillus TaxID=400634 RepID=UPI00088B9BC6|nr:MULTISPECIES: thiamine diphosphokinase [unclassified Lysinibacillus]MEE3806965.1 thiamine diphosphokinase [Lysinibacillus fusiformis]WCH48723.1 thiamine diphosphokinase [Lysinibacillus sp. OF-1]SCX81862.1 thiamine diphosphokinase [Lysinibacillus sp. SG9]SDB04089.1 thiamine diphosphokinase [Lysinibacillus sp. TC-37]SFS32903.1 thiamine diphosphokinase [Lysinibacillus sp. SG55]
MTIVVVCAGGPKQELCSFSSFQQQDVVFIGADRGALYLLEHGITPHAIVGDFDSLTDEEYQFVMAQTNDQQRFQEEKNETDTDLALLKAYTYAPQEIVLTGVTGGRLDHYEAAVRSIYRLQKEHPQIELKIINHANMLQFLLPGTHTIFADDRYRYLSFFAHEEPIQNVTLRQVKYETTNEEISLGTSRFTSNEIIGTSGSISFSHGICLMIRSID